MDRPAMVPRLMAANSLLLSVESLLDHARYSAQSTHEDPRWIAAFDRAVDLNRDTRLQVSNILVLLQEPPALVRDRHPLPFEPPED